MNANTPRPPESAHTRSSCFRISLTTALLFFLVALTHWWSPVEHSPDSRWVLPTAVSLVTEGDIGLNEYRKVIKAKGTYGLRKKRREYVNFFPVGPAILATPFVWMIKRYPEHASQVLGVPLDGSGESLLRQRGVVEHAIGAIIVALAVGGVFLMLVPLISYTGACLLAIAVGWGSSLWSVASRGLWQHGPAVLFLALALAVFFRRPNGSSHRWMWWITGILFGAFLGLAYLMRPTCAIPIVCFVIFLFRYERRWLFPVILGALPVAVPFVWQNLWWYSHILPPYYRGGSLQISLTTIEALLANLAAPSRGIFVLSAWSVVALFSLRPGMTPLARCLWGWCGLHLVLVSLFDRWWAGHSFGARFMSELVPPLAVLVALTVPRYSGRSVWFLVVGALTAVSIALNAPGALSYATIVWNRYPRNIDENPARIWSVSRPQSLAPLYLEVGVPRSAVSSASTE